MIYRPLTRCLCLLLLWALALPLSAQITYPYDGVYDQRDGHYALTGATVHVDADRVVEGATVVIRNGRIRSVTAGGAVPRGAVEVKLTGKHLYPSFIEIYGDYGMPEVKSGGGGWGDPPQTDSKTEGAYSWNQALRSETDAAAVFKIDKKAAANLREAGFGSVSTHHPDGISRGSAALVTLTEDSENEAILKRRTAHHLSFQKGSSRQNYPSSLMGSIALIRQTYLDADWYARQKNEETNLSIEAWRELQNLPQIFYTDSWQDLLRADRVGDEFGKQYLIVGGGDSYQRTDAIKQSGATVIVPLKFPDTYDVSDPFAADRITLAQLRHWERAPGNLKALAEAGIPFVITGHGHEKAANFTKALRKAVEAGADAGAVLKALTSGPAEILGVSDLLGTLAEGKLASFFVTDGDFFTGTPTVYQHWVAGKPFELKPVDQVELAAAGYDVRLGENTLTFDVSGEPGKQKLKLMTPSDTTGQDVTWSESGQVLTLRFRTEKDGAFYRINATPDGSGGYRGNGRGPDGELINFAATPRTNAPASAPEKEDEDDDEATEKEYIGRLTYPNLAYGNDDLPTAEKVLFRNATVWTGEAEGILENTDVLIDNGKITRIGKGLPTAGARIIDGEGMHLTAGIIDEHSHIALSSVNEGSQASSAEVRMMDVVDAVDENIYRQLAGGVTTSQLLHGSANPIGGQSALIKLRWGLTPQEMMFAGADPFIKFALGENVKQSNWGDDYDFRYPQTRMGVEQVFESYFSRAREYGDALAAGRPVRRDLELDALLEILERERFITCHSYQQGEINMLMKVAERHGFNVNTFTHILEGYKVADKMAEHGVAGSTFSDWWAYKYEVVEAIPFNGAIMHEQGVVTAFNSDDAEMARRLNQEAAKAVLFGGVSEEDAWKFVTLNPARMLHIDDRVGSIKVGKDADLVLWNDHPMSIYARADHTFVDGREYFNRERDAEVRQAFLEEKAALVQASLDDKKKGGKTQPATGKRRRLLHCNSLDHAKGEHAH